MKVSESPKRMTGRECANASFSDFLLSLHGEHPFDPTLKLGEVHHKQRIRRHLPESEMRRLFKENKRQNVGNLTRHELKLFTSCLIAYRNVRISPIKRQKAWAYLHRIRCKVSKQLEKAIARGEV